MRLPTTVALRCTILLSALALAGSTPAFGAARGEFERTLQVNGTVNLQVETGSGSIDVRTGSSNQVRVVGHIWANEWFSGNDVRIGHIDDPELKRNISISYELIVPASTQLRASSGSGSQTISGISGALEAGTGSGSLKIYNIGSS